VNVRLNVGGRVVQEEASAKVPECLVWLTTGGRGQNVHIQTQPYCNTAEITHTQPYCNTAEITYTHSLTVTLLRSHTHTALL